MPRKATTPTRKSSKPRAPSASSKQQSPTTPLIDVVALANAQAVALAMSPSSQKQFFKDNPQDLAQHIQMSKNLQSYVDLHKCLPKKVVNAVTDGGMGWVTVPTMGLCLVGGGICLTQTIFDMFFKD